MSFEKNMKEAFNLPDEDKEEIIEGVIVQTERPIVKGKDDIQSDYEYTRNNLIDTINHAKLALDELHGFAAMSQSPRAYEVYTQLTKTIVDANKDLLEIQLKLKKLREETQTEATTKITNNSLFVGSTSEFLKLINDNNTKE